MLFPSYRPRRVRKNETIRKMVRETRLSVENLIYPMFAIYGKNVKKEIPSMPGNYQLSVENLIKEARAVHQLGIPAVILFGIPEVKDAVGSGAYDDKGIIQRAVLALKEKVPGLMVITDVCLCEYTDHGHCGLVEKGEILNDPTLELLAREAVSHARAGADMVAPSDMMDGRVGVIREALDEDGYDEIPIMSYAIKYASGFYGPFRDAAESTPEFGDRATHQMDPANSREAMREAEMDVAEGADILMVKPALPYLDIIYRVKEELDLPVAAYNVSGEFSMIKAAAQKGWLDEERVMMESLTAIRRAGADMILTYWAKEAARVLQR